jgi:hypothetical protein
MLERYIKGIHMFSSHFDLVYSVTLESPKIVV